MSRWLLPSCSPADRSTRSLALILELPLCSLAATRPLLAAKHLGLNNVSLRRPIQHIRWGQVRPLGRTDSIRNLLSRSSTHAASEPIWVLKKIAKLADICNFEVKLMGQT